jgi:exodeoxyribonuclease VIII
MNAIANLPTPSLLDVIGAGSPIRADISNAQYHADRSCVSVSGLKQILRSPAHFRAYLDGERKETPAKFFGSALHARLLEPQLFDTEYVVAPPADRRTKEFKEFEIANANRKILTAEQMTAILGIEHNVMRHSSFAAMLRIGLKEHTIVWRDAKTGIWIKIRPDCLCTGLDESICLDVKSTEDASPAAFARSCVTYDYDLQAAVYLTVLREVFQRDFNFAFGPAEKSEPYGVAVYGAPEDMLERGVRRMRLALDTLRACLDSNTWPSYQPDGGFDVLEWPRWAA